MTTPPPVAEPAVLLPCPFCGEAELKIAASAEAEWVVCNGCGAEGPWQSYQDETAARNEWNTRSEATLSAETAARVKAEGERDEALAKACAAGYAGENGDYGCHFLDAAMASAIKAEARVRELEEALRPFARLADDYLADTVNFDDSTIMAGRITCRPDEAETPPRVTFADFRRARTLLADGRPKP